MSRRRRSPSYTKRREAVTYSSRGYNRSRSHKNSDVDGAVWLGIIVAALVIVIGSFLGFSVIPLIVIAIVAMFAVALASTFTDTSKDKDKFTVGEVMNSSIGADIKIMKDCVKLVNESANVEVVLGRYDLLIEELLRLTSCPKLIGSRASLCTDLERMRSNKVATMNAAVKRAYDDMERKSFELKTEAGRKNRRADFFKKMNSLSWGLPAETVAFIASLPQ